MGVNIFHSSVEYQVFFLSFAGGSAGLYVLLRSWCVVCVASRSGKSAPTDASVLVQNAVREIKIKKGLNIPLLGAAERRRCALRAPETYAVKATDFHDIRRPKVLVEVGDPVKAGVPLLHDKFAPEICYVAPVSGEVARIVRGARRALESIVILADPQVAHKDFPQHTKDQLPALKREAVIAQLCEGGVWPRLVQRPYGIVANPKDVPRDIYISAFNTHPLAPDYAYTLSHTQDAFKAGLSVLKLLTSGKVNIGLPAARPAGYFEEIRETDKVRLHKFRGPHPAGNVGVHIHHTRPIAKGEIVWTVSPYGVAQIGKLFLEGKHDASITLAITGSQVTAPAYYDTYTGVCVKNIVEQCVASDGVRCISGSVLTGERIEADGYLGYYHDQLTVIPEGNHRDFFGWIKPSVSKFSMQRAVGLLSFLFPAKKYEISTNVFGEPRAFLQTGLFGRLLPMDIHVDYLLKAILANDYDDMEALGIYEVVEEDLALCEFADISKHEIQKILREGIDLIRHG